MAPRFWLVCFTFVILSIFLFTSDISFSRKHSREFSTSSEEIEFPSKDIKIPSKEIKIPSKEIEIPSKEIGIFREWHACLKLDFDKSADDFWKSFGGEINKCAKIEPPSFRNRDETKHAFLPKNKIDKKDEIVVTLGVGKDIKGEQELKKSLLDLGITAKFYGADPMYLQNAKIFAEIGSYFPLAVGATTGMSKASILNEAGSYENSEVYHIELIDYLKDYLNLTHVDHLWMDNEYPEYDLFPYFYKGGQLEQAGISICQMNMEVHIPNGKQQEQFQAFVQQIIKDRQWAFLKQVYVGHYRLFLFNFGNSECVKKYFDL